MKNVDGGARTERTFFSPHTFSENLFCIKKNSPTWHKQKGFSDYTPLLLLFHAISMLLKKSLFDVSSVFFLFFFSVQTLLMNFIRQYSGDEGSNFMNFPLPVILTTGDEGRLSKRKNRRRKNKNLCVQRLDELSDLQNNSRRVPFITCLFSRPKTPGLKP